MACDFNFSMIVYHFLMYIYIYIYLLEWFRQLGATFLFEAGGSSLLEFRQKSFADHLSQEEILQAFGLDVELLKRTKSSRMQACDEDHCA